MGMFDKMKEAKNMYSNIKKAQNEINKMLHGINCRLFYSELRCESSLHLPQTAPMDRNAH